jgi:cytochrome c556
LLLYRLFFRLQLLAKNGTATFEDEDDEEEELAWDNEEEQQTENEASTNKKNNTDNSSADSEEIKTCHAKIKVLENENTNLKREVKKLAQRVNELEGQLLATQLSPKETTSTSSGNRTHSRGNELSSVSSSEGSICLVHNPVDNVIAEDLSNHANNHSQKEEVEEEEEGEGEETRASDKLDERVDNVLASLEDEDEDEDGWS